MRDLPHRTPLLFAQRRMQRLRSQPVQHQPKAMAHAIQRLRHDKHLTAQLSKNGAEMVQGKWSVKSAVEHLERQLTQVATREASPNSE